MRILMVVRSDVIHDARVMREATTLVQHGHEVTAIGETRPGEPPDVGFPVLWTESRPASIAGPGRRRTLFRVLRWLLLPTRRRWARRRFGKEARKLAKDLAYDAVHAHDLDGLVAAGRLAARAAVPLVYDAHEMWTGRRRAGRPTPIGDRWDAWRERRLGSRATAVLTVSDRLAQVLRDRYRWEHVSVVRNTFPVEAPVHAARGLAHMVYAGRIGPGRDLETVFESIRREDSGLPALVLLGPLDPEAPAPPPQVIRKPAVDIADVPDALRRAGLAIVSLDDSCENHRVALPNKLFQAVSAGVPVVASDLPAMREFVAQSGAGTLYQPGDPDSFAAAVREVRDHHHRYAERAAHTAPTVDWASKDGVVLAKLYRHVAEHAT